MANSTPRFMFPPLAGLQPIARSIALPQFQDARDYQILFLSLFLILGIGTRDWTLRPISIVFLLTTCLLTQWLCSLAVEPKINQNGRRSDQNLPPHKPWWQPAAFNVRSPLITGLGLSLLLRADRPSTLIFAAAVAISSKFLLRYRGKHFFNPANVGIIAALVLTSDAWVSPGQWGDDLWYGLVFLGAGGVVLGRVGRLETTGAFLGCYGLLEALRNYWLGWTWDVWLHRLGSGSLLLFALFMITDPRAIPDRGRSRVVWAIAVAGLTFILRNRFFVQTSPFWALFLLSPLTLVLDRVWQGDRFLWRPKADRLPR